MFAFVCRMEKIELNKRLSFLPYIALSKAALNYAVMGFLGLFLGFPLVFAKSESKNWEHRN